MTRALIALLLLAPIVAGDPAPHEPGVSFSRLPGLDRLEAVVPGRVIDYALPRLSDGRRDIILLVGADPAPSVVPEEDPEEKPLPPCPGTSAGGEKMLYRVRTVDPPELVPVRVALPPDAAAVGALDLDGDGNDESLLASPGKLHVVETDGLRLLVEDPDLVWAPEPRPKPHLGVVASAGVGVLKIHGPHGDPPAWGVTSRVDLPIRAKLQSTGLKIHNPLPTLLEKAPDGTLVFATEPEAHGDRRLRVLLVTVSPAGGVILVECWCRLPRAEQLLSSNFLRVDGTPLLLVQTRNADKLSLFAEKQLRLFPLKPDRSRMGMPPLLSVESRMNLWQVSTPILTDVDQDGREDLVVGYWKGLSDHKLVLDVYLRLSEGWFDDAPRSTAFNVEQGDRGFLRYGADLTGDGTPDLLLRSARGLVVHPGRPSRNGKRLVDERALDVPVLERSGENEGNTEVEITIGSDASARVGSIASVLDPAVVDIDGDGTGEILAVTVDGSQSTFHAVWVHPGR